MQNVNIFTFALRLLDPTECSFFFSFGKITSLTSVALSQVQLVQSVSVPALVTGIWPTMGKTASLTMDSGAIQISSTAWMEAVCPSAGNVIGYRDCMDVQMSSRECVVSNLTNCYI